MQDETYSLLNRQFKATCRILFQQEIGDLSGFGQYLKQGMCPSKSLKSTISGKTVMVSSPHYPNNAKYVSQDEVSRLKPAAFNINDIKDVDSLFGAAQEIAVFCGNKMFGKNFNVDEVDNCADCINILHSHNITNTKYAAYCSVGRDSNSIYGVHFFKGASHSINCIHCIIKGATRCFESHCTSGISDSYYTLNCSGCTNCMFCFNLRSKNYMIGNLELPKERYLGLKEKLVFEIAEILKNKKRIFSIADLFQNEKEGKNFSVSSGKEKIPEFTKSEFATTSNIVLEKTHIISSQTSSWLSRRVLQVKKREFPDGSVAYSAALPILEKIPLSRLIPLRKALNLGASAHIEISGKDTPSLAEIQEKVSKIAFSSVELVEGQVQNCLDTVSRFDSINCYRTWLATRAKHSGFHTAVTESEYIFGGYFRTLYSKFCIDCDNITSVSNCFGCDSCYSCRNCYFCHNCEDVTEGILCFNMKGGRYAVLNQEVQKEEYKRVKALLLDYVNSKIEVQGGLDFDIFSIGAGKSKNNE